MIGWIGFNAFFVFVDSAFFFVNGTYLSFYLAICLDFYAFQKQFVSIMTKLGAEARKGSRANQTIIKQKLNELVKHHMFMKE